MNRRQFIMTSGTGIAALAGCTSSEDTDREQSNADNRETESKQDSTQTEQQAAVEILSHEFYQENYSAGVRGIVENKTDDTLKYVSVEVYFLDSDGVQIGDSLANTTDLAAGRKWKFEAPLIQADASEVDSYEITAEVTDY